MNAFVSALDAILRVLRVAVFGAGLAVGAVALVDWLVRTRRLSPFGAVARFVRTSVDPLLMPIERRIVRAGGMPTAAPWWALVFVVVAGILLLTLLGFVRNQIVTLAFAFQSGPAGVYRFFVSVTIAVLKLALAVRVISSWVRLSPYSRWIGWSYRLTEPLLRPLRQVIPMVGVMDITPIVAWFALWLIEGVLLSLV